MLSESAPAGYLNLVGAIIRSGLKYEGPDYLLTDGGKYWCSIGNLDPALVRKLALEHAQPRRRRSTPAEGQEAAA